MSPGQLGLGVPGVVVSEVTLGWLMSATVELGPAPTLQVHVSQRPRVCRTLRKIGRRVHAYRRLLRAWADGASGWLDHGEDRIALLSRVANLHESWAALYPAMDESLAEIPWLAAAAAGPDPGSSCPPAPAS